MNNIEKKIVEEIRENIKAELGEVIIKLVDFEELENIIIKYKAYEFDFNEKIEEYISQLELIYNNDCLEYLSRVDPGLCETQYYLKLIYGDNVPIELIDIYKLANIHLQQKLTEIITQTLSQYIN